MGAFEIVLIVFCSLVVVGVIAAAVYKKVKGISSGCDCGCSCSSCPHACPSRKTGEEKK